MTCRSLIFLVLSAVLLASVALASPKGGGGRGGGGGSKGSGGSGRGSSSGGSSSGRGSSSGGSGSIGNSNKGGASGGSHGSTVSGSNLSGGKYTSSSGGYYPIIMPVPIPYHHSGHYYGSNPNGHAQDSSNSSTPEITFSSMDKEVGFYEAHPLASYPTRVVFKNLIAKTRLVHTGAPAFTNLKDQDVTGPEAEWEIRWTTMDYAIPNTGYKEVPVFQITLNGGTSCLTSRALSHVPNPDNSTEMIDSYDVGTMPAFDDCNKNGFADTLFSGSPIGSTPTLTLDTPEKSALFDEFAATLWFGTDDPDDNGSAFHINSYQGALRALWTCMREDGTLQRCTNGIADLQWNIDDLTPASS
ncbi:hypothetical protein BJ684DRAFT_16557 [Piptocephalis cylindrospora]|uniref:Uncharacterized protein n=1 Tax=Piptocephalis cylindrospora TaxID=1907219 RepID=A0A4P9Y298_9FUNG|nr:hypothetical protein BJ684DRAFT_16557 [Piptocephalis cylindrospora]|eukprot:RKP13006.1 hypothetical protein BJ684DRAFT_16557 [Piptocephalis cylindrospora]